MRLHIKTGDNVRIISGDHKGSTGTVLRVFPKKMKAIVEGINMVSKHVKPQADQSNPSGGIIEKEAPIHVSNLMVIDAKGNATRTFRKKNEKGYSVRVSKKSGEIIA